MLTSATGILSLLVAASAYILMCALVFVCSTSNSQTRYLHAHLRSSQGVKQIGHKLLLLGVLVLYASSVVYWAATLGFVVNSNRVISNALGGLFSSSYSADEEHIPGVGKWYCIMSAAFTVNVRAFLAIHVVWILNGLSGTPLLDLHRRQHRLVARSRPIPR